MVKMVKVVLLWLCSSLVSCVSFKHVVVESLEAVPVGWAEHSLPSPNQVVHLTVNMAYNNIDKMVENLYAVSTTSDVQYGKHWSRDRVNALVKPSDEAVAATIGWLNSSGIADISISAYSLSFKTTVETANALIGCNLTYFARTGDGTSMLRTLSYSVPHNVREYIELIHPTTFFDDTKPGAINVPNARHSIQERQAGLDNYNCSLVMTPSCVRDLYNIPHNYTPTNRAGAYLGFASFGNQSAQYSDLQLFEDRFNIKNQSLAKVLINGGVNHQDPVQFEAREANLDSQIQIAFSHPLPVVEYIVGGFGPFKPDVVPDVGVPWLEFLNYLLAQDGEQLPQVISISYAVDEQTVPRPYAIRVCNMIGMLGLRGISVLGGSGDSGLGAACRSNSGTKKVRFTPGFPSVCPYYTSVGGTSGYPLAAPYTPEHAWAASGGGFSDYFARPFYQQTAVNTYINKYVNTSTALFYSKFTNFSGRGYPDIAADSQFPGYYGFLSGEATSFGGTSASGPLWAATIAMLNDARLNRGKPALGFLNPWIYSSGYKVLRDVTRGFSEGCQGYYEGAGEIDPTPRFNATPEWDPVTGWGVPDFIELLKVAKKL